MSDLYPHSPSYLLRVLNRRLAKRSNGVTLSKLEIELPEYPKDTKNKWEFMREFMDNCSIPEQYNSVETLYITNNIA